MTDINPNSLGQCSLSQHIPDQHSLDQHAFEQLPLQEQHHYMHLLALKALQYWELSHSQCELIKYRENGVFKITNAEGEQFALRLHRPGYHSDLELRSELLWIQALKDYGFEVPEVIPSATGELLIQVQLDSQHQCYQADLFAWVDGEQLGSLEDGLGECSDAIKANFYKIGEMAAQLHNHATQWQPKQGFQRHAWDLEGLIGESPFWGRFWELDCLTGDQIELLQQARIKARSDLITYGITTDNYSLIHADFVPENLLVDGEIVRLIDFDDAGFGWHLFELATALYFIQDETDYELAKSSLIEGYRSQRALLDTDLGYLDLFLAMRAVTYLGWVQSRQETKTAKELTPYLVDLGCRTVARYLADT